MSLIDFDAPSDKVISPDALAHVVLRTSQLPTMLDFYTTFLGGKVAFSNGMLAFMTYDHEHHRIAFIGIPGTAPKVPTSCGLEHIAFTFPDLTALALSYRQRRARGIDPVWCVNHGPTTSIYYKDPDGNMLETQVDNFDTAEETSAFLMSPEFSENPIGTDFDPERLVERLKRGDDDREMKKRVEMGKRGIPDFL